VFFNSNLFFLEDLSGFACSYSFSNNNDESDIQEWQECRITEAMDHEIESLDEGGGRESCVGHR